MGVYEGRGQLAKAMKELTLRWSEAKSNWDDAKTQEFEERFLVAWERELHTAVGAMDVMSAFLQQARRDCE